MRHDVDIAIVGGGPAGLSTWLHLNALAPQLAARTLLIERERYPRDKPCGGGVTRVGDLLLRAIGVEVDCPSVAIQHLDLCLGGARQTVPVPGALRVVRRREFDHALARAAVDRGMRLCSGDAVIGCARVGGRVRLQTTAGEVTASAVVAADGAQSGVRRALGLGDDTRLARLIEVVTPVADAERESAPDTAVFDFTPLQAGVQGYIWHFPCVEEGRPAMNRGIYDSRVHPRRERADLRRLLTEAVAARAVDPSALRWTAHPLRWFGPPGTVAVPNVVLVGDAAGVDPLLGEGIAPSLDYGDLAAQILVEAFASQDLSFEAAPAIIAAHPVIQLLLSRGAVARELYGGPRRLGDFVTALRGALLGGT